MGIDNFSLMENYERNILRILSTDLDVGLTFVRIAKEAHRGEEKQKRNTENARKAYTSVVKWLKKLRTGSEEHGEIAEKLQRLRSELEELGTRFGG